MKVITKNGLLLCMSLFIITLNSALADSLKLKPFILASDKPGDLKETLIDVKKALTNVGFIVKGEYAPYPNTYSLIITHNKLLQSVAYSFGNKFSLAQRVSITEVGNNIQVAYANPVYMGYAYQIKKDMKWVFDKLTEALGFVREFGAKGLSQKELGKYRYAFGMERFSDYMVLATYSSHKKAVKVMEKNLAEKKGGVFKISRIDVKNQKVTLFNVGMSDGYSGDKTIMGIIDSHRLKHSAHLPYEILIKDKKVIALHPRFRIAIGFPDLRMMGKNSFMEITKSPDAIQKALTEVAGGQLIFDDDDDFDDF